jgi:hypothetical protein
MNSSGIESTQSDLIERNFSCYGPNVVKSEKYARVRHKAKELAYLIDEVCPPSRERELAMDSLEEVTFWTNAGIARNK